MVKLKIQENANMKIQIMNNMKINIQKGFEKINKIHHTDNNLMNNSQQEVVVRVVFSRWHFITFNYK